MKKIINLFKNWTTTKTTLYIAILAIVFYTLADCIFGIINTKYGSVFYFDSTLTSEWFDFWKWVVISGGTISVTKVLKKDSKEEGENKG